jgi:hypothetical protein
MSARSRKQVAVVVCSPVPNATPAGIKMPSSLGRVSFQVRQASRLEKTFSFPRIESGPRGRAGSPVQMCFESLVARPPNRLTSSRACGPGQYASILRAFELGHVMNTTLEGPRNRRRSAHASSHFFELRRVQRCRRALAFGLSASAEFAGERAPVLRCAIVCGMRLLLYEGLRKSHSQTEKM